MKVIVGLGNIGDKYKDTRHNVGFLAIDFYIENGKLDVGGWQGNFQSQTLDVSINDQKIIFVKPETYMNNSGEAVKEIFDYYKVDVNKDLLIIHDDSDLPFGSIKTTNDSSSAGHNGVQNVIDLLGTKQFHRIRVGVEARASRQDMPTEDFVLQKFSVEELELLSKEILPKVSSEIENFIQT